LLGGLVLLSWGADRFTVGAVRISGILKISVFYLSAVLSGFEPEDLSAGLMASAQGLPQIAFSTVIGGIVFMLTAGLGAALLVAPIEVRLPRQGCIAIAVSLLAFAIALWNDGTISRTEGGFLFALSLALMLWLYRCSVIPRPSVEGASSRAASVWDIGLLVVGLVVMIAGAELVAGGVQALVSLSSLSETFLGMTVVSFGQSLEETARMVPAARRGYAELVWGNVVGTIVILLGFNLGVIALFRPVQAAPLILRLHAPFMVVCTLAVLLPLVVTKKVGRRMGLLLAVFFVAYVALNFWFRSR